MTRFRPLFWICILLMIIFTVITEAHAENDCLDYCKDSGEPIMLVGIHPYFYGTMDSNINHYVNYEIIDNETIEIHDYKHSRNSTMSMRSWDEIRPGVYYDGFNYFKLFIYREPQRYWRRMI